MIHFTILFRSFSFSYFETIKGKKVRFVTNFSHDSKIVCDLCTLHSETNICMQLYSHVPRENRGLSEFNITCTTMSGKHSS